MQHSIVSRETCLGHVSFFMLHLASPLRPWVTVTGGRWNAAALLGAFIRPACHVSAALLPSSQDEWNSELQICNVHYQKKLEIITKRLKEQLKRQKWPKLTQLEFGERCFQLPIRFEDLDHTLMKGPVKEEADVRYLAGFFDGDGCVSAESSLSGCFLQMTQTAANNWILFQFLMKFGGGISMNNQGCGSAAPVIAWRAYGEAACCASFILQKKCIVKEEQLKIAASWPRCREDRDICRVRLAQLKKCNQFSGYLHKTELSWDYVSGFFDAEGCIFVDQACKSLRLSIGQRDPEILQVLQVFLLRHLPQGSKVNLYSRPSCHVLTSSQTATSLAILTNLLEHGLQVKRSEALHALNVSTSSHSELRRNVGKGKGKQSYFRRLDEAGCARRRAIRKITSKVFQAKSALKEGASMDSLQAELASAKLQHQVLNAQTQIQKLRSFIASIQRAVASNCWKSLTSH